MLSRQSHLIVTNADLEELTTLLLKRGDVQFLSHEANESRTSLLPLASLVREKKQRFPMCYLAPLERPEIVIQSLSDVKTAVDVERSELVEFWRSYRADNKIQAGPLRYTARYFDAGQVHEKSSDFVKWAEQVVRFFRRSLTYDKALDAHVGRDAARLIASAELRVMPPL